MSIGEQLVKARILKKLSASELAAATRMNVQIVNALEQEDFDKIPAAIYGKGFIRLYAEYVGLDPKPLIEEYVMRFISPPPEPVFDDEDEPSDESDLNTASNRKLFFGRRDTESNIDEITEPEILVNPPKKTEIIKEQQPSIPTPAPKADDFFADTNVQDVKKPSSSPKESSETIRSVAVIIQEIQSLLKIIIDRMGIKIKEIKRDPYATFLNMTPLRMISTLFIVLIILIVFGSAFSRCIRTTEQVPSVIIEKDLNVALEPPDTYLD